MEGLRYKIMLRKEPEGGYTVIVPEKVIKILVQKGFVLDRVNSGESLTLFTV